MANLPLLLLDVDGVLTDGRLYYRGDDEPLRGFHAQDGLAIRWYLRLGGAVAIITGKQSRGVAARAAELGIAEVVQGSADKLSDARALASRLGADLRGAAMVGDDLPDLPVLRVVRFPIAVANAVDQVRRAAGFVTRRSGGDGAVREAIEHVLSACGRWQDVLRHYDPELSTG